MSICYTDGHSRYSLQALVDQVPHYDGLPLTAQKSADCLRLNVDPSSSYVWPDVFISLERTSALGSPILLVSAPGAMGKTVAAKAVAANLRAPLIDLSSLSVGSDTLTGLLARVLGWSQAPELINNLRTGKAAIVLDGLDEAQLRAGRMHTVAFLENIIEIIVGSEASIGQIIIFGRREAIETSAQTFLDNGIEVAIARIAPLTHEQSNQLINLYLDHKTLDSKPYEVHRIHSIPFASLRDALFMQIAVALGASNIEGDEYWREVGDFLGYPPVLLVFAERLAVVNPSADPALAELGPGATRTYSRHGDLLKRIVEGILDRESQKVRQQLSQALSLAIDDQKCRLLYTREEQSLRILKYASGRLDIDILPPVALDNGERVIYEEQISTFVPDHPFLNEAGKFANVVFADYVRAFVAIDPLSGAHGASRAEILRACPPLGPFFAGLVNSIALEGSSSWFATLDNDDLVDDLIKSYFLGAQEDAYFLYAQSSTFTQLSLYMLASSESPTLEPNIEQGISFKVSNPSGVLELTSPLRRGGVVTQSGVVLKSVSDEIEIGPDFTVVAETLQIKARRLTALGGRSSDNEVGVLLVTAEMDQEAILTVNSYPSEALSVSAPELWHIWRRYAVDMPSVRGRTGTSSFAIHELVVGVRRILTSFRRTVMNSEPSVFDEWLDRYGTGSNPIFNATLDGLIELGVVEKAGSYYRLVLSKLSSYGVNYAGMRGADFTNALKPLTEALLKTDVVKSAIASREEN